MGINKEEFNLNDLFNGLSFEDVIDGLNKYFAEDETRVRVPRSIVEIRSPNKILFYRFDAEMYLDKLIAWLRTEHGIFYYPGMEAKYAKMERIPPLTERLMDEGALNSLKKLYKRVTGEEPEVDSHTLIADGISHAVSVKEVQIEELKEGVSKEIWEVNNKRWNDLHDIQKALGCDRGMNGHVGDFAKEVKARATYIKSEHDITQTKLDTIEKKLEDLLNDIKEDLP